MSDKIRPTPVEKSTLLMVNEHLDALPKGTFTAILEVPTKDTVKLGAYVEVGNGWSFMGWLEHKPKNTSGGVAVRKKFGLH